MATGPYFRYMTNALSCRAYIYSQNKAMYIGLSLTDFYGESNDKRSGYQARYHTAQMIQYNTLSSVVFVYSADDAIKNIQLR